MTIKKGDHVEWKSQGHTIRGTVEKLITEETQIKGHHVAASPENPEYVVESDATHSKAAHHPDALKKVRR